MSGNKKYWKNAGKAWPVLRPLIFGVTSGCAAIAVMLYLTALMLTWQRTIPENMLGGITTVILCIAALTSGFVSSFAAGEKGLIYGMASTAILTAAIFIAGTCLFECAYTASSLIKAIMMILCGAISGIIMVNRKPKIKF